MKNNLPHYCRLMRLHSPSGMLLLWWPTGWGLWLAAKGIPDVYWLAVFAAGVFVMRALGCVINDIVDRRIDKQVARTRARPLAAGDIRLSEAAGVALLLLLSAFGLWRLLPPVAQGWALPALAWAAAYPFAKHCLAAPQIVLGIAFGFGIPVAFAAVTQTHPSLQAWLFFVANGLWVVAYDTVYAMADREDDRRAGVNSTAIWFAGRDVKIVSGLYVAAVLWLSLLGVIFNFGVAYQVALIAGLVLVFRFWRLYRTRVPAACMAAFHSNHWFGAFVLAGLAAAFA